MPLLAQPHEEIGLWCRDLLFLDIALESSIRQRIERDIQAVKALVASQDGELPSSVLSVLLLCLRSASLAQEGVPELDICHQEMEVKAAFSSVMEIGPSVC